MAKKKATRKRVETPFSKNLSDVLKERGLTQRQAASIAGVSQATVADWLSGAMPSDALAVQRLCQAVKCDFEWLLTGVQSYRNVKDMSLSEIFEAEDDPMFSGIFEISAKRLKKRK